MVQDFWRSVKKAYQTLFQTWKRSSGEKKKKTYLTPIAI